MKVWAMGNPENRTPNMFGLAYNLITMTLKILFFLHPVIAKLLSPGTIKDEAVLKPPSTTIALYNNQEEHLRTLLSRVVVSYGIDAQCFASLIKAWFRELLTAVFNLTY